LVNQLQTLNQGVFAVKKFIGAIVIYLSTGFITLIASNNDDNRIVRCEDLGFIVPKGRQISVYQPHNNPENPINKQALSRFHSSIVPWISSRVDQNNQERKSNKKEDEGVYRESVSSDSTLICANLVRVDGIFSFAHFKEDLNKLEANPGHHGHHGGALETENGIVVEVDRFKDDIAKKRADYMRFIVHYEVEAIRTLYPDDPEYIKKDRIIVGSTLRVYLNQEDNIMFVEFVRPAEYLVHSEEIVETAGESNDT